MNAPPDHLEHVAPGDDIAARHPVSAGERVTRAHHASPSDHVDPDQIDRLVQEWRRELPDIADVHLELTRRIGNLHRLLADAAHRELSRLGHTYAEYEVLGALRRVGHPYVMKPGRLSGELNLSTGGTSNVLRRLSEAHLVSRRTDQTDGRSSLVTLTPEGVAAAERAVKAVAEGHRRLLQRVPEPTARALADLLREVTAHTSADPWLQRSTIHRH